MAFPRKLLNDDEDVIFDLRPHWSTLARPTTAVVLAIVVLIVLAKYLGGVATLFGVALTLVAAAVFLLGYLRWNATNFVLTTDRLIYRSGVLAKRGKEIPLERISDISYDQRVWERLIGTGDVSIESAGKQSRETFADVPHPADVQNRIYQQMEAVSSRRAERMSGRRDLSLPEQLEKLDELRQRGVISQAEFDAKKRQLLDRM